MFSGKSTWYSWLVSWVGTMGIRSNGMPWALCWWIGRNCRFIRRLHWGQLTFWRDLSLCVGKDRSNRRVYASRDSRRDEACGNIINAIRNDLESLPVKWCRRAHKPRAPQNRRTNRDRTENRVDWTAPADYFDWTEPWMGQNQFT
jgi:hypothetical protein